LSLYQVIIFEKNVPNPFLFKSEYQNELFIEDDFFVVYKEHRLYYYQEIKNNFDLNELKNFILKNLDIKDIKIYTNTEFVFIKNDKCSHKFIKPIKSLLFKYYIIYILVLCASLYFFEFNHSTTINPLYHVNIKTEEIKKSAKFFYLSNFILEIYEHEKEFEVKINSIEIVHSKVILTLSSIKKDSMYSFLNKYKNYRIENMLFDDKDKRFKSNASFDIYRK